MRNITTTTATLLAIAFVLSGCNQAKDTAALPQPAARKSIPAKAIICPTNTATCMLNTSGSDRRFFEAVSKNNIPVIIAMLKKDSRFLAIKNTMGAVPLHIAAMANNPGCLLALIKAGADVNAANKQGRTPLHVASAYNNLSDIKILLENGASVSPISRSMNTPLHDATKAGNIEAVKYLVAKGASINSVNNTGATPLKTATKNNHKDIAKFLISKGANKSVFCCADL